MPSSIDIPLGSAVAPAGDPPMAFRRQRYWFLSFVMTPFKDIDDRAAEQALPRKPGKQRRR